MRIRKALLISLLFVFIASLAHATDRRIQYTDRLVGANSPIYSDTINRLTLAEHDNTGAHGWVDVTNSDYGAVGDGVTDDTAAVQAAIDAAGVAGVGKVKFPAGTYFLESGKVNITYDNITLEGVGDASVIKLTTANPDRNCFRVAADNFTAKNLKFTNDIVTGSPVPIAIYAESTGVSNATVSHCSFYEFFYATAFNGSSGNRNTNIRIEDNYVKVANTTNNSGIFQTKYTDGLFYVRNFTDGGVTASSMNMINFNVGAVITDNIIKNNKTAAVEVEESSSDVIVENNIIVSCGEDFAAILIIDSSNVKVSDNVLVGTGGQRMIWIGYKAYTMTDIYIEGNICGRIQVSRWGAGAGTLENVYISDNLVDAKQGITYTCVLDLPENSFCSLKGNAFRGATTRNLNSNIYTSAVLLAENNIFSDEAWNVTYQGAGAKFYHKNNYYPEGATSGTDQNALDVVWSTPEPFDLSGSAKTYYFHTEETFYLSNLYFTYSEASSADAGITIKIGKESDDDYHYTGTTEVSKSQWYTKELTLLATKVSAGDTLIINCAGGKTGAGEVFVEIR